ncbi:MAG: ABC transporter ATP-binding protein/permease [Halanaerobiales bacterium]|nr:ABC transporter ATP-binding protein/permease [Halanaerobiales bacterium]
MKSKREWNFFKDNKSSLIAVIASNILANIPLGIFSVFLYMIIMQLTVPILANQQINFTLLKQYRIWYVGTFIVYILLSMWSQTNNYIKAYTISSDLRLNLGDKLSRISMRFFKERDPGDVIARLLSDVQQLEMIVSRLLPDIAAGLIAPIILIILLANINMALTGIMITSVVFASIFLFAARKVISILGQKHIRAITDTSSRVLEYFKTIKLLKSYDMIGDKFETMNKAMLRLKKLSFRAEVWTGIPIQLFLFCLDAGYLLMLLIAVKMCTAGNLTIVNLFAFAVIGYYFYEPIKSLGTMLIELRYMTISINRISEIFEVEEPSSNQLVELPKENDISFSNVKFSYKENEVLKAVSCHLPEKSMTALVGPSGSGKTTMTSLIARFWDVQSGEVCIGGVPLAEIEPDKLLSKISMVFQDVYLFNDSVANNIRVGNRNASDEEVISAAKLACCDEFIRNLPDGYDTLVSEGGSSLSGGERQRLSIARAILKDAPVVMLDEATASLDPENEAEIQEGIENLVKNKTIIVIAHRFKSIENANQILVLDRGTIVERGPHKELIRSNGLYSRLWQEQQKARGWKMKTG